MRRVPGSNPGRYNQKNRKIDAIWTLNIWYTLNSKLRLQNLFTCFLGSERRLTLEAHFWTSWPLYHPNGPAWVTLGIFAQTRTKSSNFEPLDLGRSFLDQLAPVPPQWTCLGQTWDFRTNSHKIVQFWTAWLRKLIFWLVGPCTTPIDLPGSHLGFSLKLAQNRPILNPLTLEAHFWTSWPLYHPFGQGWLRLGIFAQTRTNLFNFELLDLESSFLVKLDLVPQHLTCHGQTCDFLHKIA